MKISLNVPGPPPRDYTVAEALQEPLGTIFQDADGDFYLVAIDSAVVRRPFPRRFIAFALNSLPNDPPYVAGNSEVSEPLRRMGAGFSITLTQE
jgi:hypothetical protein